MSRTDARPAPGRRRWLTILFMLALGVGARSGSASVAVLVDEPFGTFGTYTQVGHSAVYLDRICADGPSRVRMCSAGEMGVVLARYHRVGTIDWMATPLLPYLYSVDDPDQIPRSVTAAQADHLREQYRTDHLAEYVSLSPSAKGTKANPGGEWRESLGAAFDRRIWGFQVPTTVEQDEALVRWLNSEGGEGYGPNKRRYSGFKRNCANFVADVVNFYYPHAIAKSIRADFGIMTPKEAAMRLTDYSKAHPAEAPLKTFTVDQVSGSIRRSTRPRNISEGAIKTKRYLAFFLTISPELVPVAVWGYHSAGRFQWPVEQAFVLPTSLCGAQGTLACAHPDPVASVTFDPMSGTIGQADEEPPAVQFFVNPHIVPADH